MSGPSSLAVTLGVRPPRLGVLVPRVKGASWLQVFELALATQARMWGGSGNLLFPLTAGIEQLPLFWELADRLDADHWATYAVTYGDTAVLDPKWHAQDQAAVEAELTRKFPDIDQEARQDFLERRRGTPCVAHQPQPAFRETLRRRLAPLQLGPEDTELEACSSVWEPHWPFTDVAAFEGLPPTVRLPRTSLGSTARLLLTSELGRFAPDAVEALATAGVSASHANVTGAGAWVHALFERHRDPAMAHPWTISEHGLAWYLGQGTERRVSLVVGDGPWDFALFYALRRWTSLAYWLPSWLERNPLFMWQLARELERWARRTREPVLVVTASSSKTRCYRAADEVRRLATGSLKARTGHWSDALPDEPNRLFEKGNWGGSEHLAVTDGLTTPLPTPLPRNVRCRDESEMRWMTEVAVDRWTPVRHPELGPVVVQARSYDASLARTTRTGAAYFSPNPFFLAAAGLEAVTVRPRLLRLSLEEQIRYLAERQGWQVKLSDKGVFAAEAVTLFGGREALAEILRDKSARRVLDAYFTKTQGIGLRDSRRYLTLEHFRSGVFEGDIAEADKTVSAFTDRGVLVPGIVLKCRRCRQEDWYDISQVGPGFRCARCLLDQPVERARWRGDIEPLWFYRLAEVVYQFIDSNGHLPVLAVEERFAASGRPVDKAHELKFVRKDTEMELDIAVANGYQLWLGEATTTTQIEPKSRIARFKRLALGLGAYGVIFATSQANFADSTGDEVDRNFGGLWPRREVLTKVRTRP